MEGLYSSIGLYVDSGFWVNSRSLALLNSSERRISFERWRATASPRLWDYTARISRELHCATVRDLRPCVTPVLAINPALTIRRLAGIVV